MQDERSSVFELLTYYRGFHHTLVTWHVTILGFVFAGTLAADPQNISHPKWVIAVCSVIIAVVTVWFIRVLGTYSGRIEQLKQYWDSNQIPANWRVDHYDAERKYSGEGSVLFIFLLVFLALTTSATVFIQLFPNR